MFSLQLSLDGKAFVKCSNHVVGELIMEPQLALDILRVVNVEYKEIYRLIIERAENGGCSFYKRSRVIEGELLVEVVRSDCGIFELITNSIFPLSKDRLSINYVKCKKTYVIKPALAWLAKDLRATGVIK